MTDDFKPLEEFNAEDRKSIRLLEESVFFLTGEISSDNINDCIKWIVYENLKPEKDKVLTIFINSFGGDCYQAFGLIDVMKASVMPIRTIGVGSIMSSAFLICASGTKGFRFITPNTGIMCHQFSVFEENGKYHDIKATRKETDRINDAMIDIMKEATGLDKRTIQSKFFPPHDVYLTAEEMIQLGAADELFTGWELRD